MIPLKIEDLFNMLTTIKNYEGEEIEQKISVCGRHMTFLQGHEFVIFTKRSPYVELTPQGLALYRKMNSINRLLEE